MRYSHLALPNIKGDVERVFGQGRETEMTTWRPEDSESPNRMDALVWVISELMLGTTGGEVSADVI